MNDANSLNIQYEKNNKKKTKALCVQVHVGWLNTMATNNYRLLESTYLSLDYIV